MIYNVRTKPCYENVGAQFGTKIDTLFPIVLFNRITKYIVVRKEPVFQTSVQYLIDVSSAKTQMKVREY